MPITALYAAWLAPLFILLSVRVIRLRISPQAALGDAGDPALLRRMRVQANFAEYVPFALILIGLGESLHAPVWLLHGLGAALVFGRLLHAWGVSREPETFAYRIAGMILTFATIIVAALTCLIKSFG